MVEDENKGFSDRQKKIATITLMSASIAFIASVYFTSEEDHEEDHFFSS